MFVVIGRDAWGVGREAYPLRLPRSSTLMERRIPEQGDQDRQADGGFGGGTVRMKKHEHLAGEVVQENARRR